MKWHRCPVAAAGGAIDSRWCFDTFADVLLGLPPITNDADVRRPELTLATEGLWTIAYCPFDWVNPTAKVVIVGITPGQHQMTVSNRAAQEALRAGATHDDALRQACAAGSFAGPMRRNLVTMLDDIGLNRHLGIGTTATLFTQHTHLLHSTSALLYPVFYKGKNYTGSPDPTRSPLLRRFTEDVLPTELALVPDALVIPLGRTVTDLLHPLGRLGRVNPARCLLDFPHPSGGNGHRARLYKEHRDALTTRAAAWSAGDLRSHGDIPAHKPGEQLSTSWHSRDTSSEATSEPSITGPRGIYAVNQASQIVRPHLYRDGRYRVSRTRYAVDQIPVSPDEPLAPWLQQGYHLRMSADGISPSLFSPHNIHGWRH